MDHSDDDEGNVLFFQNVVAALCFQLQQKAISDLKSLLYIQYAKADVGPEDSDVAPEALPTKRVLRSSQKRRRISNDKDVPVFAAFTPSRKSDHSSFNAKSDNKSPVKGKALSAQARSKAKPQPEAPVEKDKENFEAKRAKLAGQKRKAPMESTLDSGAQYMIVWQQNIAPLIAKIHALREGHRKEPGGIIWSSVG